MTTIPTCPQCTLRYRQSSTNLYLARTHNQIYQITNTLTQTYSSTTFRTQPTPNLTSTTYILDHFPNIVHHHRITTMSSETFQREQLNDPPTFELIFSLDLLLSFRSRFSHDSPHRQAFSITMDNRKNFQKKKTSSKPLYPTFSHSYLIMTHPPPLSFIQNGSNLTCIPCIINAERPCCELVVAPA